MTRLHPDDIQAIAERVVALLPGIHPIVSGNDPDYVSPAAMLRIKQMAREDLAAMTAKKAAKQMNRGTL